MIREIIKNEKDSNEIVNGLTIFFDLLARFDYEDKQKEKLVHNSELLVSAPKSSELDTNFSN